MNFDDLVGCPAVRRLAHDLGFRGRSAADAVDRRPRISADDASSTFLDEFADRLASGLATIVAVLDPELVVLDRSTSAGQVGRRLAQRVQRRLHRLSQLRPLR